MEIIYEWEIDKFTGNLWTELNGGDIDFTEGKYVARESQLYENQAKRETSRYTYVN